MLNSFTYKGYTLVEDEEIEPMENRKIFHMVTPPGGKEFMMKMTLTRTLPKRVFNAGLIWDVQITHTQTGIISPWKNYGTIGRKYFQKISRNSNLHSRFFLYAGCIL